ncbi:hypothetical protein Nepgr_002843 [Nepenthes gracilis]|uniref:Uncharacterized protein n=1 Tax=Nepenthes gracilis TaxID=150966 RepID=A0AAD3P725_NEPGR|nr:hypothetical protein Nepgr_002843 [Nepenthes gracilis]
MLLSKNGNTMNKVNNGYKKVRHVSLGANLQPAIPFTSEQILSSKPATNSGGANLAESRKKNVKFQGLVSLGGYEAPREERTLLKHCRLDFLLFQLLGKVCGLSCGQTRVWEESTMASHLSALSSSITFPAPSTSKHVVKGLEVLL